MSITRWPRRMKICCSISLAIASAALGAVARRFSIVRVLGQMFQPCGKALSLGSILVIFCVCATNGGGLSGRTQKNRWCLSFKLRASLV